MLHPVAFSLFLLGCAHAHGLGGGSPHARRLDNAPAFASPHAYEWFIRGELALHEKNPSDAVTAYQSCRTSSRDDPLVNARLASALAQDGKLGESKRLVGISLRKHPRSEPLLLQASSYNGQSHHVAKAVAVAPYSRSASTALAEHLLVRAPEVAQAVLDRQFRRTGSHHHETVSIEASIARTRQDYQALKRKIARQDSGQGDTGVSSSRGNSRLKVRENLADMDFEGASNLIKR